MGDVNKLFVFKSVLTTPSNILPLHLKKTFPPIISIFTEGDGIESRLPFKIFSTLQCSFSRTYILVHSKVNMDVFFLFFFTEVNLILKCIKA